MLNRISDPLSIRIPRGRTIQPIKAAANANVLIQVPTPALLRFVKRFVIVEFPSDRKLILLPTTSFGAVFRFRGESAFDDRVKLPRAVISGLRDTVGIRIFIGGTAILLVMFTEIGASAFMRYPLDIFFNTTIPIEKVFDRSPELNVLDEQLVEAKDHVQRIQIVELFLLEHLLRTKLDPVASIAVARIEQEGATARIEEVARQMGLSQSALERRFRRNVGTSPKRFASILRLMDAIRLGARGHDFTSIAHSAGYSDQSHFTNDFKRVTGFAPSAFFQQTSICRNAEFLQVAFISNS
jgi:AraC-like DNA-binding protein